MPATSAGMTAEERFHLIGNRCRPLVGTSQSKGYPDDGRARGVPLAVLESGLLVLMCQSERVIPRRRSEAESSPESLLTDLWLWIPGSRPAAEPRNDQTRFRLNTPRWSEAKPSLGRSLNHWWGLFAADVG